MMIPLKFVRPEPQTPPPEQEYTNTLFPDHPGMPTARVVPSAENATVFPYATPENPQQMLRVDTAVVLHTAFPAGQE